MSRIDEEYQRVCTTPGDIFEHLPTLCRLSSTVTHVAEFGVRNIVSTWAFLKGLRDNGRPDKRLLCLDIDPVPGMDDVIKTAAAAGITVDFMQGDSARCAIPKVDLLFIDTWHVYGHLRRELAAHCQQVRQYIVLHDTEVDKVDGESIRMEMNIKEQVEQFGYPEEEIRCGLQRAVDEFLEAHPQWEVAEHYENNNGLTVLKQNN